MKQFTYSSLFMLMFMSIRPQVSGTVNKQIGQMCDVI